MTRALSADEGISRADYFDANLAQPVPQGVLAGGVTNHYVLAGAHPSLIDPEARLSYKDEFVGGFGWQAVANTALGVRYIFRTIGRVRASDPVSSAGPCSIACFSTSRNPGT